MGACSPGRATAWVCCTDKVGILGAGELCRDEVADRLERRRPDGETFALRLDDELIPPELGELFGAARDQRLGSENA